jgi:trans-2,3-dihydro-3-hydroxyanthranilate isomerase
VKKYAYITVDVFTARPFAGNPVAVIADASGLTDEDMQRIAAEFNYSESTFVFPPDHRAHTARVRIFTPRYEVPFAGHPNVGTAFALAVLAERSQTRLGSSLVFEENAGLVPVEVLRGADGASQGATLTAPEPLSLGQKVPAAIVADCVGLHWTDVITSRHDPVVTSVGLPFVIAEVDRNAIGRARPNAVAFARAGRQFTSGSRFSIHLYARAGGQAGQADLQARMFAPLGGVPEDPATGSANGALVALLASLEKDADADLELVVLQGAEMGRPSLLRVSAEKRGNAVTRVRVGGRCVAMMEGVIAV